MLKGVLVAESLRTGCGVELPGVTLTRVERQDVSGSTTAAQPSVWTLLTIEGPDEVADRLAETLAASLLAEGGWYADFSVREEHVVVFADRVFRYRRGDPGARTEVERYGRQVGVPPQQLDWED